MNFQLRLSSAQASPLGAPSSLHVLPGGRVLMHSAGSSLHFRDVSSSPQRVAVLAAAGARAASLGVAAVSRGGDAMAVTTRSPAGNPDVLLLRGVDVHMSAGSVTVSTSSVLTEHDREVTALSFGGSRLLVTACREKLVAWDVASGLVVAACALPADFATPRTDTAQAKAGEGAAHGPSGIAVDAERFDGDATGVYAIALSSRSSPRVLVATLLAAEGVFSDLTFGEAAGGGRQGSARGFDCVAWIGDTLAAGSTGTELVMFDTQGTDRIRSAARLSVIPMEGCGGGLTALRDLGGGSLAAGCGDGTLVIMRADSRAMPGGWMESSRGRCPRADASAVTAIAADAADVSARGVPGSNPDGLTLFVALAGGCTYATTVAPRELRLRVVSEAHGAAVVASCAGRGVAATASEDGTVRVWDPRTGVETARCVPGPKVPPGVTPLCVALIPGSGGGDVVVSGWTDGALRAHAASDGSPVWELPQAHPRSAVTAVCVANAGAAAASAAQAPVGRHAANPTLTGRGRPAVNVITGQVAPTNHNHNNKGHTTAVDAWVIVTGGADGEVRTWDARTRSMIVQARRHGAAVIALCALGGGRSGTVASTGRDRAVVAWDAATGQIVGTHSTAIGTPLAHAAIPGAAGGTADPCIAVGNVDGSVGLWATADRDKPSRRIPVAHEGGTTAITASSDGELFATGGADGRVKVWSSTTGKLAAEVPAHTADVTSVAFVSDNSALVSTGRDGVVLIWARV